MSRDQLLGKSGDPKSYQRIERLDRSYRWIKKNWNAKNVDVPDELLFEWMFSDPLEEREPSGFHLAVFTFGYLQHKILMTHGSGTPTTVSAKKIMEMFDHWQVKLALAAVDRRTEVRVSAVPLFSFADDETVEAVLFE